MANQEGWLTRWFWSLVLTRSRGKTQVTPMIPAIPPLMILGRIEKVWPPVGAAGVGTDVTACGQINWLETGLQQESK